MIVLLVEHVLANALQVLSAKAIQSTTLIPTYALTAVLVQMYAHQVPSIPHNLSCKEKSITQKER